MSGRSGRWGWFTKRGPEDRDRAPDDTPDADLGFLGAREADRFRAVVRRVLAEEAGLALLEGERGYSHALPWADGIVHLPVVDLPDSVEIPPLQERLKRGELSALLERAHPHHRGPGGDGGPHPERVEPGADLSHGVVFAVPYRHQVDVRVVDGASAAMDALMLIPRFAVLGFEGNAGPLSPHTYLWHDGEVSRLSRLDEGRLSLVPGAHRERILDEGSPPGW